MTIDQTGRRVLELVRPLLGELDREPGDVVAVEPHLGRNVSGTLTFDNDEKIFVKVIKGMGAGQRFSRSVSFAGAVDKDGLGATGSLLRTPRLLAHHDDSLSTAHEHLAHGSDFGERFRGGEASDDDLLRVGRALGTLHALPLRNPGDIDSSLPNLPPHGINAISQEVHAGSTMGQLEVWRILQNDQSLRDSLGRLVDGAPREKRTAVHGDMRADQVFLGDACWILDWEEFRLGDPARDLGSMLGEVFYHQIRHILDDLPTAAADIRDEDVVARGVALLNDVIPQLRTLWLGYGSVRQEAIGNADFAQRCVGYFGWQLFDRALASGTYYGRLSALDRAIAGIGREALHGGSSYAPMLGLVAA